MSHCVDLTARPAMNTIMSVLAIFARTLRVSSLISVAQWLYGAILALYLAPAFTHLRFLEETAPQVSDRVDVEQTRPALGFLCWSPPRCRCC